MSKSTSALVCVPWDMFTLIKSNYLLILSCFFLILMADMVGGSFQSISHGVHCRTIKSNKERKFISVNHSTFADRLLICISWYEFKKKKVRH